MEFINVNGDIFPAESAFIKPGNHSYRYGDGLFETMKVVDGHVALAGLHFERLYKSLSILKFQVPESFTKENLEKQIFNLCKNNDCEKLARVRLSVSRGHGGLYDADEELQYILECRPLQKTIIEFKNKSLIVDYFPDARKSCDAFSNIKSASHLHYVMAAQFCKENNLNDCFVLNSKGRVCDSTIANVFWIRDKKIFTPPLGEGCISGVMRRHLIDQLRSTDMAVCEKHCELKDLRQADEIFVTNAIQGIKWIRQFSGRIYANDITEKLYNRWCQSQEQ